MEKTFTTNEVLELHNALEEFTQKDIELSAKVAWNIEDNLEELKKIVDKFEKHRVELVTPLNEAGAFTQEGENIRVAKEYEKDFIEMSNKLNEYLMLEHTVNVKTITKDQLPDKCSVKDLRAVKFMIESEAGAVATEDEA